MFKRTYELLCFLLIFFSATLLTTVHCDEFNQTKAENAYFSERADDVEDEKSSLDEFYELFTVAQLRQGWIVLHVFAAIYFFILLAYVCNDYFLPTVECICDDLNVSKDVAAATFMATATSMPEFFTNTISTLITETDMGLGTIMGSLMFNTLGVAGVAALAIRKPVQLDWWPIIRDCLIYIFNLLVLLILAWGGYISFIGSCIMMAFLVFYYVLTFNSNRIRSTVRIFIEDRLNCCLSRRYDLTEPPENSAKAQLPIKADPLKSCEGLFVISFPTQNSFVKPANNDNNSITSAAESDSAKSATKLFALPHGESKFQKFWWAFTFPIRMLLQICIPNPITHRKLYPISFIMCIVLIGANAYMIVWMLTAFGVTVGVPDIVMGLTFCAAGSNMPEAISSLIALRNGENGIGVSNSLGANSLAILLSLGVPWFVKNCINYTKTGVDNGFVIEAQGFEISVLILIASTVLLFIILSFSDYRLTKRAGLALFLVYSALITLLVLMQMSVIQI